VFYCFLWGQPWGALTSIKRERANGEEELRRGGDKVKGGVIQEDKQTRKERQGKSVFFTQKNEKFS
jgi:hypothetical protein